MSDDSDKLKRWAGVFGIAVAFGCCGALAYSTYITYVPTTPAFFLSDPSAVAALEKQDVQHKAADSYAGNCSARPTGSDGDRKGLVPYEIDCSGNKSNLTLDVRSTMFSQ